MGLLLLGCFQISRACALGVFGMQLGGALGFIVPPTLVKDHIDVDDIGHDINLMCWVLAVAITPVVLGVVICKTHSSIII